MSARSELVSRHLKVGWWAVLVFVAMGLVLESMHGFKVPFYLDVGNETRRLMWTLAHTHGTLFGLLNVAFAATVWMRDDDPPGSWSLASKLLIAAVVLMPSGFALGGAFIYQGDPGLGILLAPIGGLAMLGGAALVAMGVGRRSG